MAAPTGSGPGGERTLADEITDYVLYAPVGLVLSIGEELPKLVEKGKSRVEGQITMARTIGQFAVSMGRRKAESMWKQRAGSGTPAPPAQPVSPPAEAAPADPPADAPADPSSGGDDLVAEGASLDTAEVAAASGAAAAERPVGRRRPAVPATGDPGPDVASLAIPGYDSLAASQVVQRLEGLSAGELEDVRLYEEATRSRRTILSRIHQLSDSSPS